MGWACSAYGRGAYRVFGGGGGKGGEGDHLEIPVKDRRIILKRIFREWDGERIGLI
jgi:hypothetical protein